MILGFFMTRTYSWGFLVAVGIIFFCLMIVRQAKKEELEEERESKTQEKARYETKHSQEYKKDDD